MTSNYLKLIEDAYQGEVYGEAMYSAIAERMENQDHAYKWRVLAQMETETKLHMRVLVAKLGGTIAESEDWRNRGKKDAEYYASLSWVELMKTFEKELEVDIAEYASLEEGCPLEDAETLHRLTKHEILTKEFCHQEIIEQGHLSILPIIAFLENPPNK